MSVKRKSTKNRRVLLGRLYGEYCFYCGDAPEELTVDHIIPTCRNGSNTLGNKVLACKRCNNLKGHMAPEEFVRTFKHLLRPGFDWMHARRAEYDAKGVPCVCVICGVTFHAHNYILKFCTKPCSLRGKEVHNRLFRESPMYARLLFGSPLDVPHYIYKEYA